MDLKKLFEIWKNQKENKNKIVPVDENFYEEIAETIKSLENEIKEIRNLEFEDAESFEKLFLRKEKSLLEYKKTVERIFKLRLLTLLTIAYKYSEDNYNLNIKGLSKEEKKLLGEIVNLLKDYRIKVLKKVLKGEKPEIEEEKNEEEKYLIVSAKSYIPQFIGTDLRVYGPFEPEEVFSIPEKTAEILLKKDKIKIITKMDD